MFIHPNIIRVFWINNKWHLSKEFTARERNSLALFVLLSSARLLIAIDSFIFVFGFSLGKYYYYYRNSCNISQSQVVIVGIINNIIIILNIASKLLGIIIEDSDKCKMKTRKSKQVFVVMTTLTARKNVESSII